MSAGPSIADLLEQSQRHLAATDARLFRRMASHLQHTGVALNALQDGPPGPGPGRETPALLGRGSFLQQPVARLKRLCKEHGIKGYSKLHKAGLAKALESHGVAPPPPPLESFTKKELIALVKQLMGEA
ncbi:MAG: hypothetical protein ACK40D_02205 [Cyanobacteriota bacterium]|jgi:hypothetical protein